MSKRCVVITRRRGGREVREVAAGGRRGALEMVLKEGGAEGETC